MTITVEQFASGPQKQEFYHDWIEAKNRAQELANKTGNDFALFGEDHDLEAVILPERGGIATPFPQPKYFSQNDNTVLDTRCRVLAKINPLQSMTEEEASQLTKAIINLPVYYELLCEASADCVDAGGQLNDALITKITGLIPT